MNHEIFGKDYHLIESCGEGSFAEVFKVQSRSTGKYYAIKRLKQHYRTLDQVSHINEIIILRSIGQHPNIIKLEDVLYNSESGSVALVFEYMENSLLDLLSGKVKSQVNCQNCQNIESVALIIIYQILKAISHLHSNYLFHRDIKPENILIDSKTLEVKLTDFGSARLSSIRGPFTDYITTRWYRAPECILTSGSYGPAVDIWAVGCILFEIIAGRPLFPGKNEIDQITKINQVIGTPSNDTLAQFANNPSQNTPISNINFQKRQPLNLSILLQTTNMDLVDLMKSMLEYNPIDRISAENALNHPVFAEIRQYDEEWQRNFEYSNEMQMPKYVLGRLIGEINDTNDYNENGSKYNADLSHQEFFRNKKDIINSKNNNYFIKNNDSNPSTIINDDFNDTKDNNSNRSLKNDENKENNSIFLTKKNSLKDKESAFLSDKTIVDQQSQSINDFTDQNENQTLTKKYNILEPKQNEAQRIRKYQTANQAFPKKKEENQKSKPLPYNFGRLNNHSQFSRTSHKFTGISYQKPGPDIVVPQIPHNNVMKK